MPSDVVHGPPVLAGTVETMSSVQDRRAAPPGPATTLAASSTAKLEKLERTSLRSVDTTHRASAVKAGSPQMDAKSLPAAATTTTPAAVASALIPRSGSACTPGSAPRLRLMTSVPFAVAQRMPAAISPNVPPSSVRTFTGMTMASRATPAIPMPLSVAAAAIPATWVPWADGGASDAPDSQSPPPHGPVSAHPVNVDPGPAGWRGRGG